MRAPASIPRFAVLVSLVLGCVGCAAERYVSAGPDYTAAPPKTVQVRVIGVGDAQEPEGIAIDGRFLCHNYDPGRRNLPKCPKFRASDDEVKFELETFVAVGEHRVSVVGWGESSEIKAFKVFMADVPVLCEFDGAEVECQGIGTASIIDSVDTLMSDEPSAPSEPPPSIDAPMMDADADADADAKSAADAPE